MRVRTDLDTFASPEDEDEDEAVPLLTIVFDERLVTVAFLSAFSLVVVVLVPAFTRSLVEDERVFTFSRVVVDLAAPSRMDVLRPLLLRTEASLPLAIALLPVEAAAERVLVDRLLA